MPPLATHGLDRFVTASYGVQHQVDCQVEEAIAEQHRRGSALGAEAACRSGRRVAGFNVSAGLPWWA